MPSPQKPAQPTTNSGSRAAIADDDATKPLHTQLLEVVESSYFTGFVRGVVDSMNISSFLSYCLRSESVLAPTLRCFAMNLALVGSIVMFTALTQGTPLELFVYVSWQIPMRLATDVFGFYGWSLYPSMFYAAQEERNRRRRATPRKIQTSGSYMGEKALRTLMQVSATLLKVAVSQVPLLIGTMLSLLEAAGLAGGALSLPILLLVGLADWVLITPICFVLDALVYSFFCFECRLEQQGKIDSHGVTHPFKLSQLIALFESCWTYYVGYGFVQHFGQRFLVAIGLPVWASCLYAAIMPMNVVTALDAAPGPHVPLRLPLFSRMCVVLGQRLARFAPGRRATAAAATTSPAAVAPEAGDLEGSASMAS